jgi:hypothetical protein
MEAANTAVGQQGGIAGASRAAEVAGQQMPRINVQVSGSPTHYYYYYYYCYYYYYYNYYFH